jgi:ribonuclease HI
MVDTAGAITRIDNTGDNASGAYLFDTGSVFNYKDNLLIDYQQGSRLAHLHAVTMVLKRFKLAMGRSIPVTVSRIIIRTESAYTVEKITGKAFAWAQEGWRVADSDGLDGLVVLIQEIREQIIYFQWQDVEVRFWKVADSAIGEVTTLARAVKLDGR